MLISNTIMTAVHTLMTVKMIDSRVIRVNTISNIVSRSNRNKNGSDMSIL